MLSLIFNIIGFVLDILGVILVFVYGLSPTMYDQRNEVLKLGALDEPEIKKARRYKNLSLIGLALLITGFLCQAASSVISYCNK